MHPELRELSLTNGPVHFEGVVDLEQTSEGILPWRLPLRDRLLYDPELCWRAQEPAGVRLTLVSDTERLEVEAGVALTHPVVQPVFDLLADGQRHRLIAQSPQPVLRWEGLPPRLKVLELYLPPIHRTVVRALRIDPRAVAYPCVRALPVQRWIAYGSSITQAGMASGPTETWPALAARQHELDLLCLGFAGQCHLDVLIARLIRDLPANLITLGIGINVHGRGSFGPRTFASQVIGFVKLIRERHSETPIGIVSPIFCPQRETLESNGLTLRAIREQLAEVVDKLRDHGDPALHYFDGTQLVGPADVELLHDGVHPDAQGYRLMARRVSTAVIPALLGRCAGGHTDSASSRQCADGHRS